MDKTETASDKSKMDIDEKIKTIGILGGCLCLVIGYFSSQFLPDPIGRIVWIIFSSSSFLFLYLWMRYSKHLLLFGICFATSGIILISISFLRDHIFNLIGSIGMLFCGLLLIFERIELYYKNKKLTS